MERYLGTLEHTMWLCDQIHPLHFATVAKLHGQFSLDQLKTALTQVQQRHPLLRVHIATDAIGQPKFVEADGEIPIRVPTRTNDQQWQRELEVELSHSFDWQVAPLIRVVLLQSGSGSELIIVCHHAIADGISGVYLVRDIAQGLEGRTFERAELSEAVSMESAIPGIAPRPEATTQRTDYATTISTRSRPHVQNVVLTTKLSQQLVQRSRAEQTTIHGAISAAFLLVLAQQTVRSREAVQCFHPISVRSQLSLPIPDGVGLYLMGHTTIHNMQENAAFWEMARSIKSQLSQIDLAQQLIQASQNGQLAMANLPDAATVAAQLSYDLMVTNLGRIDIAQQQGSIWIESLYAPAVLASMKPERSIGVATLSDRISLTLSSAPLDADPTRSEAATAFLLEGVKHLENAVVGLSPV